MFVSRNLCVFDEKNRLFLAAGNEKQADWL